MKDSNTLEALKAALSWLCKAHADGLHEKCAMPRHLDRTIQRVEDAIRAAKEARAAVSQEVTR